MSDIALLKNEINQHIADPATFKTLLEVTFKGLTPDLAKRAMLEAMMRGMTLQDFLQKNVYAIPFRNKKTGETTYSLVNSIDYARKVGMRSGIVGKSAPTFEEKEGKIISCTVTVKRKIGEHIGDYSATVYFEEYNTGQQQWASRPRTMLAKVAESHALRMACPEELSQSYLEEEYDKETTTILLDEESKKKRINESAEKLSNCKNLDEVKTVWASIAGDLKPELTKLKDELKTKYENITIPVGGTVVGSSEVQDNGVKT